MIRKLNWMHLDYKSTLHYSGLTCVLNKLETIKTKHTWEKMKAKLKAWFLRP